MSRSKHVKTKKNTSAGDRRGVVFRGLVLFVAVCALIVSIYNLGKIYLQRRQTLAYNESVANAVLKDTSDTDSGSDPDDAGDDSGLPFTFDAQAAQALSPDCIGYLYIPAVDIGQPIAKADNDTEYLKKELDGSYSESGTPFVESVVKEGLYGTNVMIFGHSVFGVFDDLKQYYEDESFATDPANQVFYIYHGDRVSAYRLFSIVLTDPTSDVFTFNFQTLDGLRSYANDMQSRSIYPMGTDISDLTQVMSIACCEFNDFSHRLVFFGTYIGDVGGQTVSGSKFTPGMTQE